MIETRDIGKAFRIGSTKGAGPDATVWESVAGAFANALRRGPRNGTPDSETRFWALRDINLAIAEGEVVGVIGRNGSGKSTLLKILSDILEPTEGRAEVRGRVASLLEVGTGFHGQLTGRENIFLNGALIGMKQQEIRRSFDRIVEFSGIGRFLDTPVKRYSSGMYVRLAFAVAAHLEPEVLIVDEVLAVGDFEFQQRCLGRMAEVARDGRTVLFVSHNVGAVEALCSRCVLLEDGHIAEDGEPYQIAREYRRRMTETHGNAEVSLDQREGAARKVRVLRSARILDDKGDLTTYVPVAGFFDVRIGARVPDGLRKVRYAVQIDSMYGMRMLTLVNPVNSQDLNIAGDHEITCRVKEFPLAPGVYRIGLVVLFNKEVVDMISDALLFTVVDGKIYRAGHAALAGVCVAPSEWAIDERDLVDDGSAVGEPLLVESVAGPADDADWLQAEGSSGD